jgi:hypothetical protein
MAGEASFNGDPVSDIDIEIDVAALANALLHNQKFIDAVAKAVRNQMLKDVRTMKTLFAQWGGTSK